MKSKKWPNIDFRNRVTDFIWPFSLLVLIVTVVLVYRVKDHRQGHRLSAHRSPMPAMASAMIEVPPQTTQQVAPAPKVAKNVQPTRVVASKHKFKKHARHHKAQKGRRLAHKKHKKHAHKRHSSHHSQSSIAQSPMLVQQ